MGDKIITIQADCTGHGVPGAFMSLIGINILEEINEGNSTVEIEIVEKMKAFIKVNDSIYKEVLNKMK